MVAGYAAKQMVELGLRSGELAILSADSAVPYERPPLSKSFLAGKDSEDAIKQNPIEQLPVWYCFKLGLADASYDETTLYTE